MIKFFRKVRQRLLSENKFSKYLLYAIGEIILVVIGILIALQINTWNEDRKERSLEKELLMQLQSEFESNLNQLDQKVSLRNEMISASFRVLSCIDNPENCDTDSLITNIGLSILAPTFDPIMNDVVSSGRIQLIQSSILKERLSKWTSELIQVTEEEKMWTHYRSNGFVPFLLESGFHRTLVNHFWQNNTLSTFHLDESSETNFQIGESKHQVNISKLLADPIFEGYVAQSASFAELTNSQSFTLRQRIVEIINELESELK